MPDILSDEHAPPIVGETPVGLLTGADFVAVGKTHRRL
jgi:hypothetical protein